MQAAAKGSKIVFRMTATVWTLVGLSDTIGYTTQTYPSYEDLGGNRYAMLREDLEALLWVTNDRAICSSWEHSPTERRALRMAAEKMRAALAAEDL